MSSSSSTVSRRMMLVPLPLPLQHLLVFASDNIPTLTLISFVVIQFVLNILHYIPAKYWRLWVDRTRIVLKSLLDSDYRHDKYQLDLLRQKLAEAERRSAASTQELELSTESNRSLRERLLKLNQEAEQHKVEYSGEVSRVKRQLDAQGKLLTETEGLLETLRAGGEVKSTKPSSDDKKHYLEQISALEKQVAGLTKERKEIAQEVANMKTTHLSFQERFDVLGRANMELLHDKQELTKQLEALKTRESQLVASRDQFLGRLNTELQNSSATKDSVDALQKQLQDAATSKATTERLLQDTQQQLATAQAQSKESQNRYTDLQERLKVLEETKSDEFKRLSQTEASEHAELEQTKIRLVQLEASLAGTIKAGEELKHQVGQKDEEIARLNEALEAANARHNKLIKPRHASHDSSTLPITPPHTMSGFHGRSNSISSHKSTDRERKISFNAPSVGSPSQKQPVTLPATTVTPAADDHSHHAADTSMASTVGSIGSASGSTLAGPQLSIGKAHHKKRQRLSSILGIHLGTPDKDK